MAQELKTGVFRVCQADGKTVGTGFLLAPGLGVTCAHVVSAAGGAPGQPLALRFAVDGAARSALVLAEPYAPTESDDVAFLQITDAPAAAKPLKLESASRAARHDYAAFGYPKQTFAKERLARGLIDGTVAVNQRRDCLQTGGEMLNYGMSGAPLLDLVLDRVVGMVTYHTDETHTRIVYATTADTLRHYRQELSFAEPDALADYRARLLEQTRYVDFTGIPLPTYGDGLPVELTMPLDTVYVRLRAVESQAQRLREREEQQALAKQAEEQKDPSQQGGDGLAAVLLLGEHLSHRAVESENLTPVDPAEMLAKHGKLVILGAPGAGKSTLLRWLARQALLDGAGRVPVLVKLGEYGAALQSNSSRSLREFALETAAVGDARARAMLEEAANEKRVLWLLDALDEARMEGSRDLREAAALPGQVLVSSRPVGFVPGGLKALPKFEVLPLSVEHIDEFVGSWFTALPDAREDWVAERRAWLQAQLKERPQVAGLARSPLLLTFLAVLAAADSLEPLPATRADLYEAFVNALYRSREQRDLPGETRRLALAGFPLLGWALHFLYYAGKPQQAPTRAELLRRLARCRAEGWHNVTQEQVETVLDFWRRAGMLTTWYVGGGEYYAFRHQTLQEYAAALALRQSWLKDHKIRYAFLRQIWLNNHSKTWEFLRPRLHLPAWREPLLLLCGSLPDDAQQQLIQQVLRCKSAWEKKLERDFWLAIDMTGEQRGSVNPGSNLLVRLLLSLRRNKNNRFEKMRIIDIAGSTRKAWILPVIFHTLRDPDPVIWHAAEEALDRLGDAAMPSLIQAFQSPDPNMRASSARALGKIGNSAGQTALLQALQDQDVNVRREAASALGEIGDATVIPALLNSLQDVDGDVRGQAAYALGSIGDATVIPALLNSLQDVDGDVRGQAASALEEIGDATVIPALLQALQDRDVFVRAIATDALVRIDATAVLPELCQALQDGDADVRWAAAEALERIGDAAALPELCQALQDGDARVRRAAAEALEQIGDAAALPALIRSVHDPDLHVRWKVGSALKKIGEPAALTAVLHSLQDPDARVRLRAVDVLVMMDDRGVLPGLLQLLQDPDADVREAAIKAFREFNDPSALPALLQALQDPIPSVRLFAADALGTIGDASVLPALIKTLQDSEEDVRRMVVVALGEIGDAAAVPLLLQKLQDVNDEMRISATQALGRIADVSVLPALVKVLRDPVAKVRREAAEAISAILPSINAVVTVREIAETAVRTKSWHFLEATLARLELLTIRQSPAVDPLLPEALP